MTTLMVVMSKHTAAPLKPAWLAPSSTAAHMLREVHASKSSMCDWAILEMSFRRVQMIAVPVYEPR